MTLPSANDNSSTREIRVDIISEALRCIATSPSGARFDAVCAAVAARAGLNEELAWLETQDTCEYLLVAKICWLVPDDRLFVLGCFNPDTVFRASPILESFITRLWAQPISSDGEIPF